MPDTMLEAALSADEFIDWSLRRDAPGRFELFDGKVVPMAPERAGHAELKFLAARRLAEAVEQAGLACTVYGDGMAVRIGAGSVYEPDASVRCGARLSRDAVEMGDPVVVVEVVSPSSRSADTVRKLAGYFSVPSVRHYHILSTEDATLLHHERGVDGGIVTHIVRDGVVRLEPPGIVVRGLILPD